MGQSSEFRGFWAAGCMALGAHDLTCQARFLLRSGLEVTPVFEWGYIKRVHVSKNTRTQCEDCLSEEPSNQ